MELLQGNSAFTKINNVPVVNETKCTITDTDGNCKIIITAYYDREDFDYIVTVCYGVSVILEVANVGKYICKLVKSEIISEKNEIVTMIFTFQVLSKH